MTCRCDSVDRVIALENELDDLRERCLSLDVETEQFRALIADAAEKVAAAIDGMNKSQAEMRQALMELAAETQRVVLVLRDSAEDVATEVDGRLVTLHDRVSALESPAQHAAEDLLPVVNGEP
jgi:chromosome segregation ATPase